MDDGHRYERIRRAVVSWYRGWATERLPEIVERWWPRLGRGEMSRILVRDQRQRWGSCAPDGTLRFNWRAMMLRPALIEYVIVHELAMDDGLAGHDTISLAKVAMKALRPGNSLFFVSLNPPKEGVALASWSGKGVLLRFWDNGFATKNRPRKRSTQ